MRWLIIKRRNKIVIYIFLSIFIFFVSDISSADTVKTIIKVAFNPNLPPYQFMKDGEAVGIHIDVLEYIAELNNLIIEYKATDSYIESISALQNDEVDLVVGVPKSKFKMEGINFTNTISQSSLIMIARNEDATDVKNKINTGTYMSATFQNEILGHFFLQSTRNLRSITITNHLNAFYLLDKSHVDVMIGEKNSLLYQIDKYGIKNSYAIANNFVAPIEYTIAMDASNEIFLRNLNSSINQLRVSGIYENIYNKWIDDHFEKNQIIKKIISYIIIVGFVFMVLTIFNLYHNHLLKRQVNKKTRELQDTNDELQRQIVETLDNSELKNRITEDNPNAIVVFDLDYIITLFNNSASRLTGIHTSPINKSVFEIDLLKKILFKKKEIIFKKGANFNYKDISIEKDDDRKIYRYIIYQLFDMDERIRGGILSIEDVTDERRMRARVMEREKNKALNQIIASVAHEIRNPLMAIKTFIELLPSKRSQPKFQSLMDQHVPEEIERIDNLIKNLIDYAKPDSQKKDLIDIEKILDTCILLVRTSIDEKDICLNIESESDLFIEADKNQLKQILINLILNGIEAIEEKKKNLDNLENRLNLLIKAWRKKNQIYVQVYDEGIGIEAEELDRILDPFFTTKTKGTGLGLPITRQYIEENGGSMTIKSVKNKFTNVLLKFRGYNNE